MNTLRYAAIAGNTLLVLWIVYNGIDEGFQGVRAVEAVALTTLVCLLIVNIVLLLRR